MPLKYFAEEHDVLIADSVTDLLHSTVVTLEQALSGGDAQFLQVDQRAVAGRLLKPTDEIARAHANALCRSLDREGVMKILVQPLLSDGDSLIGVLGF